MRNRPWLTVSALFLGAAIVNALCVWLSGTLANAKAIVPSSWVGVWQGELGGQPSVVLTLAQDTDTLEGTLVLNIVSRASGEPRIIAHEPHVLMHVRTEGDILSFQLKRIDGSTEPMDFTVRRNSADTAKIHCLNCGDAAPIVEITKLD